MDVRFSDYKTVEEAAREWNVTRRWITMCIDRGRVPGAVKMGNLWLMPKDAEKPADRRRKENKEARKEDA